MFSEGATRALRKKRNFDNHIGKFHFNPMTVPIGLTTEMKQDGIGEPARKNGRWKP
jgi:hypothetical protein